MSKEEALHQSLASCGAMLLTFNGIYHLFVAETLFPFGPAFFQGRFNFYAIGVVAIVAGILLLGAILRFYVFPVVAVSLVTAVIGLAVMAVCQLVYNRFNIFALSVAFSGLLMAYCYSRISQRNIL